MKDSNSKTLWTRLRKNVGIKGLASHIVIIAFMIVVVSIMPQLLVFLPIGIANAIKPIIEGMNTSLLDRIASGSGSDDDIAALIQDIANTRGLLTDYEFKKEIDKLDTVVTRLFEIQETSFSEIITTQTEQDQMLKLIINLLDQNQENYFTYLDTSMKWSIGRCVERWTAVGVDYNIAVEWSHDLSFGAFEDVCPTENQPFVLLKDDIGKGKSVVAERWFQKSLREAIYDDKAPIPVFIQISSLQSSNFNLVSAINQNLSVFDSKGRSISLTIDGLDTLGHKQFENILSQAYSVVPQIWNGSKFLITSAPLFDLDTSTYSKMKITSLEKLGVDQTKALMERAQDLTKLERWDFEHWYRFLVQEIKDLISRPLFALLAANNIHNDIPTSTILDFGKSLEKRVLHKQNFEDISQLLQQLAFHYINDGGQFTDVSKFMPSEIQKLRNSRLVTGFGNGITFTLPYFAYYFGAAYLTQHGHETVKYLVQNPEHLKHWQEVVNLLIMSYPTAQSNEFIEAMIVHFPAFIAQCINKSLKYAEREPLDAQGFPSISNSLVHDILSKCFAVWNNGFGDLISKLIPNLDEQVDFKVRSANRNSVYLEFNYLNNSIITMGRTIARQDTWAWDLSLDIITDALKYAVEHRKLPLNNPLLQEENLWYLALNVAYGIRGGNNSVEFISIKFLIDKIDFWRNQLVTESIEFIKYGKSHRYPYLNTISRENLNQLESLLNRFILEGKDKFYPPLSLISTHTEHGKQELNTNWIIELYNKLFEIYPAIVDNLFGNVKHHMPIYNTLPAELHMNLVTGSSFFIPLEHHNSSKVIFGSDFSADEFFQHWFDNIEPNINTLRPALAGSLYSSYKIGSLASPLKDFPLHEHLYQWITHDLRDALDLSVHLR